MPCSSCHINSFGSSLTPFGRNFKLTGYTFGENSTGPPLSGIVLGGFTNTQANQNPPPAQGYSANNNFALNQISAFVGGRLWDKVGTFSQLTYDGVANKVALDLSDTRYSDESTLLTDADVVYGVSLNNAPTVEDLWNTTPVWGFPYATSPVAPTPGATALIDGPLMTTAGGGSVYAMIDQLLYLDFGAYTTFSKGLQQGMGVWQPEQLGINGGAPYWRLALQKQWGGHYAEIGTYGLQAKVYPGGNTSVGTDGYVDSAFDFTYQYLGDMSNILEIRSNYIYESQTLNASNALGLVTKSAAALNTYRINAAYTFQQTYQLTLGYNLISSSRNGNLYPPPGYAQGMANSEYFVAEADYTPFGKLDSLQTTWMNLRLGLQYIAYSKFNGTAFNAQQNNTLFVSGWLAF